MFTCKYHLRFDYVFVVLGGRWNITESLSKFCSLFSFIHCSLPHPVSVNDPRREGALHNGFGTISSLAAYNFVIFFSVAICAHLMVDRSAWSHKRSSIGWDRIVNQSFDVGDWLENFRMSIRTFLYLCVELKSLEKKNTAMRRDISLEQRVANSSVATSYKWWL